MRRSPSCIPENFVDLITLPVLAAYSCYGVFYLSFFEALNVWFLARQQRVNRMMRFTPACNNGLSDQVQQQVAELTGRSVDEVSERRLLRNIEINCWDEYDPERAA